MVYTYEINWALKLKPEEGLKDLEGRTISLGGVGRFHKKGSRIYPLGCNIDLINQNWEVIAGVQIHKLKITEEQTEGYFGITKIYSEQEKQILTKLYKENAETLRIKGEMTINDNRC